ncbi:alpha-N-acetylgalactosamine-specific lectin-like [Diadema setosum]|uniref:alpha-N-acetylgalactosamine-specific lectin-like n=1 Tax=Diadema setosum TaxID=31175 RepID=UPI003B3BB7E2
MKFFVVTILLVAVATATTACPTFWTEFRGSCYRYFGDRKFQADAESHCRTFFTTGGQGSLVSIADDVENSFVYELFRSVAGDTDDWSADNMVYYGYWIGLYQDVTDGPWLWTDGTPAEYYNWQNGEPTGGNDEECAHVWRRGDADDALKQWNDMWCSRAASFMPYVCEMPARASINSVAQSQELS